MKKIKILRKSKICWVLQENSMTAFDSLQATAYHVYELTNRQPFDEMKQIIESSRDSEYNSWVDIIDLSMKKGVKGYGTKIRPEWFEES